MRYDVLIIGGGVIGCTIARELSRYELRCALAEAGEDVASGASRANSAIVHAGYDAAAGSMMARFNVEGNALYTEWCEQLEVPLKRCGSLVLAFTPEEEETLRVLLERGQKNGVPGLEILEGDRVREKEPAVSTRVTAALWAPTAGITCPYQMTIAAYENARANGVEFLLNAPVTRIERIDGGFSVRCGGHTIETSYVVNAAGVFADEMARLIGDCSFTIRGRKGEYMLLDRAAACVGTVLFQTPTAMGKGILVSPTVDGNVFAGPTATDMDNKFDTATTDAGIAVLKSAALKSVPTLGLRQVITGFAGVRANPSTGDFIIRPSESDPRFIHAAGICSPGLTAAPAIARYMSQLLSEAGCVLKEKKDYDPHRPAIRRFAEMNDEERRAAIAGNPSYGRVICRCETITEAEIIEAIRRGARSLDAVKRRTRAGMGRCQGGFCSPRVMELLHVYGDIEMTKLTKFGGGSTLLAGRVREEATV